MAVDAYRRITYTGGETLNLRTVEMLIAAERRCGFELVITQGSYNLGVTQSAGTHDGGGALDVRARDLMPSQRKTVETELRRVGFAAWIRTPDQGNWPYHVHAIAAGDREMSPEAAWQVSEYRAGRNGLASQGADTGTRLFVGTVHPQELDVSFYGFEHYDDADWRRFREEVGWKETLTDGNGEPRDARKILEYTHGRTIRAEEAAKDAKTAALSAEVKATNAQTAAQDTLLAVQALEARLFPPA